MDLPTNLLQLFEILALRTAHGDLLHGIFNLKVEEIEFINVVALQQADLF